MAHSSHLEEGTEALTLVPVQCCICEMDDAVPVAVGEDFEYHTSPDSFLALRCQGCGLVYLNPRPSLDETLRIYPQNYHAFDFSEERFGLAYKVRRWLESRRARSWCRKLGDDARILDVGCGDGFHLRLLRDIGKHGWQLEGVDSDERAVMAAGRAGLKVHQGTVEQLDLPRDSYDLALLIQTIEHVANPPAVVRAVRSLLRPGGSLIIVTDNADSLDFKLFKGRHWGGYHFPRHWNLFNAESLRALARKVEMEVDSLQTMVSPVNWTYSIRNTLVDWHAPQWLVNRFSLKSPGALSAFTVFDTMHQLAGRGALLHAVLRKEGTKQQEAESSSQ
ncbi:MAG: class I SAM-dependent methyltransferase [Pyrinomonadaceae bacterium]